MLMVYWWSISYIFKGLDIPWGAEKEDATSIDLPFGVPTHQQPEVQDNLAYWGLCLRFDDKGRACGVARKECA